MSGEYKVDGYLANDGERGEAEGVAAAGGVEAGGDAGEGLAQVPGNGAVMTEDRPDQSEASIMSVDQ